MDVALDVTCWASCTPSLEDEAAAELTAAFKLTRPVKTLQGQVLFTLRHDTAASDVAERLLKMRVLDYVHVLLASAKLNDA
eukprot:4466321-Prymnesium_polylepis.1